MPKVVKDFSWDKLDSILQMGAQKPMAAAILGCSEDYIAKQIKLEHGMTFTEYRESKLSITKIKLINKAINKAMAGENVMLIFCLKNLCGWRDKQVGEEDRMIVHHHKDITDGELDDKIKGLLKKGHKLQNQKQ
jgi:hypothetical protein